MKQTAIAPQDPELGTDFQGFIRQQEAVCMELEMIADGLPDRIDPHSCLSTAQRLLPLVKRAHEFEEDRLFPALLARLPSPSELEGVIERLKFEHWGDEDFAEQVYHQIREFIASRKPGTAEQLAWTLRGFFQNMRRHIAFEREFLLPMVRECPGARL
jgi:hemerythrin-like domain-containing protein